MLRRVYGEQQQGAGFGHAKIGGYNVWLRGYNPLIATLSTPLCAPVVAATRLRAGNAASVRGAAWQVAEAIGTARACGANGIVVVRADSAFYAKTVIWACRRNRAHFSITAWMDAKTRATCEAIPGENWVDIKYPAGDLGRGRAPVDLRRADRRDQFHRVRRHPVADHRPVIVRRVKRLDPVQHPGQGELFTQYRYHAVFTDSPFVLEQAEAQHRGHAVIEQVNADLIDGPLAHLPSGRFAANNAWLACAAIAHNLVRAAGHLAGPRYATARAATIRTRIINVAARLAHRAASTCTYPRTGLATGLEQPVRRRPRPTSLNRPH
jgi:hypothetical protein